MKIIGDKLRIARQIRNKKITQLAKEIDVSKQSISQFESNVSDPKGETLIKICQSLNFPIQFFTVDSVVPMQVTHTFFRALSSASALERNSFIEKTKLVTRIYDYLSEKLDFPKFDLQSISVPDDVDLNSMEELAQQVRRCWDLGEAPIWNVIGLLEEHGIIVSVINSSSTKVDAFTQIDCCENIQRYCVMLESEKKSMPRRNFSAAHELGHIILHSKLPMDEMDNVEKAELETQANMFASCFLLPKTSFEKDLTHPNDYDCYLNLKRKWHVSIKSMIFRAHELSLITYEQYISLLKKYNYRMARDNAPGEKIEPFDNLIPIERPQLFNLSFSMLFENNILTLDSMKEEMANRGIALNEDMICELLPLEEGYFDKYKSTKEPLVIKFKRTE